MSMTVAQFKTALLKTYPTRDWDQMCARLVWNTVWLTTGIPEAHMVTYPRAIDAAKASTMRPRRTGETIQAYVARAPLGAVHHWDVPGTPGHDGVSLGDSRMMHTSDHATNTVKWGKHLFDASVLSYSKGTYLGWSLTFGKNIPIALVHPTLKADQRQVLASSPVNRRTEPTTLSERIGSAAANAILTITGYRHGQSVNGTDVWFTDGRGWMSAIGFMSRSTDGLLDLTPDPPAVEPEPTPEPPIDVPDVPEIPVEPEPEKPEPTPIPTGWLISLITALVAVVAAAIGVISGWGQ